MAKENSLNRKGNDNREEAWNYRKEGKKHKTVDTIKKQEYV